MDINKLHRISDYQWRIEPVDGMLVPGIIFASEDLILDMDEKVYEQVCNVARLPGIVNASYAMPDAHWGYGFPIGGVAAFDPEQGGVISAGGVGFDISCGVRTLHTGLTVQQVMAKQKELADVLYKYIPAGLGSTGIFHLNKKEMNDMLKGGARWAVERGLGEQADLERIEEHGCMQGADPDQISEHAKERQKNEMGTLGSGNHYLEVQKVVAIYDENIAQAFGIKLDDIKISIHCGSRGLGHQIGTEFLKSMAVSAKDHGITLPDRELACAPIDSKLGQRYLGAMRGAINCALANREIVTHLTRQAVKQIFPDSHLHCFTMCLITPANLSHMKSMAKQKIFSCIAKAPPVLLGRAMPACQLAFRQAGQPVLIGGTMGTASYILAGTEKSMHLAYGSACHGAGRNMSRRQATKQWKGGNVIHDLAERGILIRSPSLRGIAEEAPGAYKDVSAVVKVADTTGLSRLVAKLEPLVCIKG